jgi:hypothetical protein
MRPLSREPCLRSQGGSEAGEPSLGLNPSDLLTLPEPQSGLLSWMMRQGQVTLVEATAFLSRGYPGQDDERTRSLLVELQDKGFVHEIEIHGVTHYAVRLAPRRGRALPADLWQALDEKVE